MSGGHYQNEYGLWDTLESIISDLRNFYVYQNVNDFDIDRRVVPLLTLARTYQKLYKVLGKQVHDLDYHFSGDAEIENPKEWQKQSVKELAEIFGKLPITQELQEKIDKIQEQIDEL